VAADAVAADGGGNRAATPILTEIAT
jgi:hypothetical protein